MIVITMIVMFFCGFLFAQVVESQKEREWRERQRRMNIKRRFERQMRNLEEFGNIEGRVIYLDRKREDRAI